MSGLITYRLKMQKSIDTAKSLRNFGFDFVKTRLTEDKRLHFVSSKFS